MTELRWGLVGASGWAESVFAPAIAAAEGATLAAVLSSRAERARALSERHSAASGYCDLQSFLASDIDAVWVASPNALHAEHAIAALGAGKHVLCEKPMALSAAQCEDMIEAATSHRRLLSIGYHMRHHPDHRTLRAEWARGDYGVPASARAQLYYAYPEAPPTWRRRRASSGGFALCDCATHLIDLLRWFLGDAEELHAALASPRFGFEVEDLAVLTLRFAGGAVGVVDASTGVGAATARLELYGTEGYCVAEDTLFGDAFGSAGRVLRGRPGAQPSVATATPSNPYREQVEAFGRAVRDGETLRVSARDGLENLRLIERARGW